MTHPEDGVLRRIIDEPNAIAEPERRHLASCPACAARADAIARDAAVAVELLTVPELAADGAAALRRVRAALPAGARPRLMIRWNAVRGLMSVAAVIVVIVGLSTSGLADSFLQIFEPKRFIAIPITESELRYLPYPQEYGTITWSGPGKDDWAGGRYTPTPDAAAARSASGLEVRVPRYLPANAGSVQYRSLGPARMTFTFNAQMARDAAARRGKAPPPMPAEVDGASLYIDVGPLVMTTYYAKSQSGPAYGPGFGGPVGYGAPVAIVIEARPPVVSSDRLTVTQLRDYLLRQPGISRQLADQIKAVAQPESTLPVPVPFDRAMTRTVNVNGKDALIIGDSTGAGSVVFWRDGNVVRAVGGPLTEREVLDIARSVP